MIADKRSQIHKGRLTRICGPHACVHVVYVMHVNSAQLWPFDVGKSCSLILS